MMKLYDFINELNCVIPPEIAEEWDNCGFQVNTGDKDVENVLVALEITDDVIEEAIEKKCDLIITHHPMLFNGVKSVDVRNATGRYIEKLIVNQIPVFSCHTNFDICDGGNNDYLADILSLDEVGYIADENITRMGYADYDSVREVCETLANGLGVDAGTFNIVGDPDEEISCIGMCSGAGAEFLEIAKACGCELFITGDLKHHEARNAEEIGINVIDAGHFGTEKIFSDAFIDIMFTNEFNYDINFVKSEKCFAPFKKL